MDRRVLAVLGAAQFLMVLDSAVMNVSISNLVADLNTDVSGVQGAITFYALVMAALMVTGGRLGDRWGRRRAFTIGLVVYAVGSGITAIAPNLPVLLLGWSVIEGVGAALVMPAMVALVAGNFSGQQRAMAYGVLGGIAGAGVAVGPIVGGWVTANLSWRVVFAAEVVVALAVVLGARVLTEVRREGPAPTIDPISSLLSAGGLALVVLAVLKSSTWGWFDPGNSPWQPLGLPLTPFVLALGSVLLMAFARRQRSLQAAGRDPLVDLGRLRDPVLRSGLSMALAQNVILMGVFFSVPLYLQVVQGFDAFGTGLRMLPVSITLFLASAAGPALGRRWSPRTIVRSGLLVLAVAIVALMAVIDRDIATARFLGAMAVLGVGIGLIASQLGNVVQSSVDESARSEVGGMQFTAQQFGAALGTALVGAVVMGGLAAAMAGLVDRAPGLDAAVRDRVSVAIDAGIGYVPLDAATEATRAANLPTTQADTLLSAYSEAQLQGLRAGLAVAALIVLVAWWFSAGLPSAPPARPAPSRTG